VRANPQLATSTQYFEGAEQEALDRQLTPQTREQRKKMIALAKTGVARLDAFLAGPLSEEQRTSASVMRWSLANTVASEPFEDYNFVFNQFGGVQVGLVNFMTNTHPMRRATDLDSYMARLEQVGRAWTKPWRGEGSRRARADPAALHPRARPVPGRPLPETGSRAERAGDDAGPAPRQADRRAGAGARQGRVERRPHRRREDPPGLPARAGLHGRDPSEDQRHRRHQRACRAGWTPTSRRSATYTSTNLTAAQIHEIGLREVARIEGEMDRHLRTLGYTEGTIEERMKKLDATFQPKGEG
jgi:hypothetical protein